MSPSQGFKDARVFIVREQGILPIYSQGSRELEEKRQMNAFWGSWEKVSGNKSFFKGINIKNIRDQGNMNPPPPGRGPSKNKNCENPCIPTYYVQGV